MTAGTPSGMGRHIGDRIPDPIVDADRDCRDVLEYACQQLADAIERTDQVRAVLAPTLVYARAWLERTNDDERTD